MEDERSFGGGLFDVERRSRSSGVPSISLTASVCVAILLLVITWNATRQVSVAQNTQVAPGDPASASAPLAQGGEASLSSSINSGGNAAPSSGLSDLGPQVVGTLAAQYAALKEKGAYTPEVGAAVASQLAPSIQAPVAYKTFSISDLFTTSDSSYARMQKYQSDLRAALAPLSKNTTPEIAIFSAYVQTGDPKYLAQLRSVTQEYAGAADAASRVVVPRDAIPQHLAILNAMEKFSTTLGALADNASEPIATMALLQTYNEAESDMVVSFNSFASYVSGHSKT